MFKNNLPTVQRSNVQTGHNPKFRNLLSLGAVLAILAAFLFPPSAFAAGPIVLDGQFGDWAGQPSVDDPQGDARNDRTDIKAFNFTTNPDDETAYFMMERWEAGAQEVDYALQVDTNNNGNYSEASDRMVLVIYRPNPSGAADVTLLDGTGGMIRTIASNAPWGEKSPGARVEWGVSFADLGIAAFQTIRLQPLSMQRYDVSDAAPEVQWSPADALGWVGLGALALLGSVWLYRRQKSAINRQKYP
jgi:hypothetical protein